MDNSQGAGRIYSWDFLNCFYWYVAELRSILYLGARRHSNGNAHVSVLDDDGVR